MAARTDISQGTNGTAVNPTNWNQFVDRINDLRNKIFDVTHYGATGDGSTDDQANIDIAHTDATANGGTLYFPGGSNSTYRFSTNQTLNSDVTVSFGAGAIISVDNGVTVTINSTISPTLHQIFATTGTGAVVLGGTLTEVYPQWWGAVGDDSTDSTAAIQAAIDVVAAAGGGKVFLPAGTYKLTSTLTIEANDVYLIGAGKDTAILKAYQTDSTNALDVIGSGGQSNIRLADFGILGNALSGHGLQINAGWLVSGEVKNMRIRDNGASGVALTGGIYYWLFSNIHSRDNGDDGFLFEDNGTYWPNAVTMLNCIGNANTGNGFNLDTANGINIIGGTAEGNTGSGIRLDTTEEVHVLGTWLENNTAGGITVTDNTNAPTLMPGKISGAVDYGKGNGVYLTPSRNRTQDSHEVIVSNLFDTAYIPNLMIGRGNILTLPASQMALSGGAGTATLVDDARSLFIGRAAKLDVTDDKVEIGRANLDSPRWIRPGNYRMYVYCKSTAGTSNMTLLFQNEDDVENIYYSTTITPPAGDVFVALPEGGGLVTVDDTEQGDTIIIQAKKLAGDDANDIYISHIVLIPDPEQTVSIGDAPETVLHNLIEEDGDGGRESSVRFKGEQSGGEVTTLAQIKASHSGAGDEE